MATVFKSDVGERAREADRRRDELAAELAAARGALADVRLTTPREEVARLLSFVSVLEVLSGVAERESKEASARLEAASQAAYRGRFSRSRAEDSRSAKVASLRRQLAEHDANLANPNWMRKRPPDELRGMDTHNLRALAEFDRAALRVERQKVARRLAELGEEV